MQSSTVSTLQSYLTVIILIGVLWMVIQKALKLVRLWEVKEVSEVVDGSHVCNEQKPNVSPDICSEIKTHDHIIKKNIAQQGNAGSFGPDHRDYSPNGILNSESCVIQHGYFNSKGGVKMTSDTDDTMAEPNSTNYTSGGGKL